MCCDVKVMLAALKIPALIRVGERASLSLPSFLLSLSEIGKYPHPERDTFCAKIGIRRENRE